MKTSEYLKQGIKAAKKADIAKLWKKAMRAKAYSKTRGLFLWGETEKTMRFVVVPYCIPDSGYKDIIEQQNPAIFIGWISGIDLEKYCILDMLNWIIEQEEILEFEYEQLNKENNGYNS